MYLKVSFRHNPAVNGLSAYNRIVESYRNEQDRVCHKTLLNIGFWTEASLEQKCRVIEGLNLRYKNELALFEEKDEQVLALINQFWNEMITKQSKGWY